MGGQLEMQTKTTPIYHRGLGERRLNKTLILLCRKEQQGL